MPRELTSKQEAYGMIKVKDNIYIGKDASYEFADDKIYVTSNAPLLSTPPFKRLPQDDGKEANDQSKAF